MKKVLLTAFGPYDQWRENASWSALVALTRELPANLQITTRRYPVDFAAVQRLLAQDLEAEPDVALHLGQAPGSAAIHLEAFGLNIGGLSTQFPEEYQPLVPDGPPAYRSRLPLDRWALLLRREGIPATVSYHAGTYLCNATLYLSHYWTERRGLRTQSGFIHLPLETQQVLKQERMLPSLAAEETARAVRLLLEDIAGERAVA